MTSMKKFNLVTILNSYFPSNMLFILSQSIITDITYSFAGVIIVYLIIHYRHSIWEQYIIYQTRATFPLRLVFKAEERKI